MNSRLVTIGLTVMAITACNEVKTTLHVEEVPQRLQIQLRDSQEMTELEPGDYEIKIIFGSSPSELTKIQFIDTMENRTAEMKGIDFSKLQEIKEPLMLTSSEIGQPFDLRVERVIAEGDDYYSIVFSDAEENIPNAYLSFSANGSDNQVDSSSGEFLASYQRVRFSKRGIMYGIDYTIDNYDFPHAKLLDDLAHFGAVLLISPWVYARYSNVVWTLQDNSWNNEWLRTKWKRLIEESPVIDFVGAYHGGTARSVLNPTKLLEKKRNQLRMFYTEGCRTGSASDILQSFNFASSIGFRSLSVSPLFTFSTVRNWVYGYDLAETLKRASQTGHENTEYWGYDFLVKLWLDAYGYNPYSSNADLHFQTEPMIAWTDETPINKIKINLSAAPKRETEETKTIKRTDGFAIRHHGPDKAIEENIITTLDEYSDGY